VAAGVAGTAHDADEPGLVVEQRGHLLGDVGGVVVVATTSISPAGLCPISPASASTRFAALRCSVVTQSDRDSTSTVS